MSVSPISAGNAATLDSMQSSGTAGAAMRQPTQGNSQPAAEVARDRMDLPAPTPHANRVGVAAYVSIMNPAPSASLRVEA